VPTRVPRKNMGVLDGLTILRYGHVYDGGGGMEQYLEDLNRVLSERNSLTTLQLQLTSKPERVGEGEINFSKGRILRTSLFVEQSSHERAIGGHRGQSSFASRLNRFIRERLLLAPGIYECFSRPLLGGRRIPARDGEPADIRAAVLSLHRRHPVDLICLHSAGS